MMMNMNRDMGLHSVEIVLRFIRKIVPHRKLAEHLIRKIDPEKIAQVAVEKLEAEGIGEKLTSKIIDKTAARLGFERGSTERGVRASPHLAARTAPWVMLPPAFIQVQGRGGYYHLVCKFYSPSHGVVATFYKSYRSTKTGLEHMGVVIKDDSNMD